VSGFDYSDVLDDFDHEDQQNSGGGLRKLLEDSLKREKELASRLDRLEQGQTVDALLKEKGINPAVKNLVPAGANVEEWLASYQEIHGAQQQSQQDSPPPADVDDVNAQLDAEREALARMQQDANASGSTVTQQDPFSQLGAVNSEAELLALIDQSKGGPGSKGLM